MKKTLLYLLEASKESATNVESGVTKEQTAETQETTTTTTTIAETIKRIVQKTNQRNDSMEIAIIATNLDIEKETAERNNSTRRRKMIKQTKPSRKIKMKKKNKLHLQV